MDGCRHQDARRRGGPAPALGAALLLLPALFRPAAVQAQADGSSERIVELRYRPTARAQIAVWLERGDGTFVETLALTQATAYRGIGNRPGASQMNSGFRWPYGRRESVLPVWGHRRAAAPGALPFRRVIFQDRTSEGWASRSTSDFSRDDYYCLSFNASTTRRDALDAVSCASVFNSDKGRYITDADVRNGYAEPWEGPDGAASMRPLTMDSLYPPRRDVARCESGGCFDHLDVDFYGRDARRVIPNLDAITMATPPGDIVQRLQFTVPASWSDGEYVASVEVHVEGDYNDAFDDASYPTPEGPPSAWDSWAKTYGYPYRGQPSVVYRVPFTLGGSGTFGTETPVGFGSMAGDVGEMMTPDERFADEPTMAPGSGADRLRRMDDGQRFVVEVLATNVCSVPEPPPPCGTGCGPTRPCDRGFLCAADHTCVGVCDVAAPPSAIDAFHVARHPDEKQSHHWARLSFAVPTSQRPIRRYEVRVGTGPIDDQASFERALPANAASLDSVALEVPVEGAAGDEVRVDFGGLTPEVTYQVAIRAIDNCNQAGPFVVGEVTTTPIHFTTVPPCFVATAAFGSPLADELGVLRRFRNRHLMTNRPGRALVRGYYRVGPYAAALIRPSAVLRAAVRQTLNPIIWILGWLDSE